MKNQTELLRKIVCPVCRTKFQDGSNELILQCREGHSFTQVDNDLLNLTFPYELTGSDAVFFEQYKHIAENYDVGAKELFAMHGGNEDEDRGQLVSRLNLQPGDRVLEISCGTGSNFPYILENIGENGELIALDLSPHMLKVATVKFENQDNLEFIQANASYLPFENDYFDAIFHVGGINTFTEKKRAIDELFRILKPSGKAVICDEGMGEWNIGTEYGDRLLKINGLYREKPPLELLPVNIENVALSWGLGNVFYTLEFTKTDHPPILNLPSS